MSITPHPSEVAAREREFDAAIQPPNADALWAMYRQALERATEARDSLAEIFEPDRPAIFIRAAAADRIISFRIANVMLKNAAQTLVDCLELKDNGAADGVVFRVPLEVGK